ncbi:submandibular gland secretory Glx-rich protein CB-like [Solanum tuberosum]|uniref:submandibular gland secretory Glx-rich protein CB-like n=1 Tax=Solanum tuberosum TaxID=4113 RepID=UPI00073A276B|nr:PREDICTED: submandibular gland secretory Glx-rich protein CB-like [Solanum tuberosum]
MKNINQGEKGQQGTDHRQVKPREQEEQQQQNTKERSNQQPPEQQKEAEWQMPKRRNNKPQEEKTQKAVWRPTSPQNKVSKEQPQPTVQQTVEGGMDEGSQEIHSNIQERVSKGGNLTHVLHEGVHTDHNPDFRASATPIPHQAMTKQQQKLQQKKTETT